MLIDGVELSGSAEFPTSPNSGDLCFINSNSAGNTPGVYFRFASTWARILIDGDAVEFDLDDDLEAIGILAGTVGILRKTGANTWALDTKNYMEQSQPVTLKTVAYGAPPTTSSASGAVTIDWSQSNNFNQLEPTAAITYTFTAPAGPCHLQLTVASDGTSGAFSHSFPGNVIWFGSVWQQVANKRAIINFWYDGTNYLAMGVNQA